MLRIIVITILFALIAGVLVLYFLPFIKKFLGIENIDDDLVFWYISKDDELDCYIVDRYFKLTGYNKPTRKQVFEMFYNSFKEN